MIMDVQDSDDGTMARRDSNLVDNKTQALLLKKGNDYGQKETFHSINENLPGSQGLKSQASLHD